MDLRRTVLLVSLLAFALPPPVAASAFPGGNGKIVFIAGDDVFTIDSDGTHVTNLTDAPGLDAANASASPDGRRIAFNVTSSTVRSAAGLYVMNANGTGLRDVLAGRHRDFVEVGAPAWSADGKRLAFEAFSHPAYRNELFVIDADGSDLRRLTNCDCVGGSFPVWSPVRAEIAFVPCCAGVVKTIDVVSGETTDVYVPVSGEPGNLTWSPDGAQLAFDDQNDVYRVEVPGSTPVALTAGGPGYYANPSWSPDGTQIVVESNHAEPGSADLYALDAVAGIDGGVTRITTALQTETQPEWAPLCESRCTPTAMTLRVAASRSRVKATGRIRPEVAGRVTVTLARRSSGAWRRVGRVVRRLDAEGRFDASFARPPGGRCRVEARYAGDALREGSRATKTFAC